MNVSSPAGSGRQLLASLSLTLRLTLLFSAVATSVLLGLGWLIGKAVEQHFVEQDMETLSGKLHLTGHLLEKLRSPGEFADLPRKLDDSLVGHHGLEMQIVASDGRKVFATPGSDFPSFMFDRLGAAIPPAPPTPRVWRTTGSTQGDGGESPGELPGAPPSEPQGKPQGKPQGELQGLPRRGTSALLQTGIRNEPPLLVMIAIDSTHHEHFMQTFRRTLWQFVALATLMTGLLGWLAVRRGLAPLAEIRRQTESVTADQLDKRLPVDAIPAELAALVTALNAMLARLEDSFRRLQDFSSDLAHELRTPVSNLMTQTQVALSQARSGDDYRDILASNAEELERLARMIGDMLFLAQAEHGQWVPNRQPVDLADEVRGLFDYFDALAEERKLSLQLDGQGVVGGDRLMLRRALVNLLSNAIRHASSGGRVNVSITTAAGRVVISVENDGLPIPEEHFSRLFDRFYRIDPSRHRTGEGAGLGLSITRSIIEAHGGEIKAVSRSHGARFDIHLPA